MSSNQEPAGLPTVTDAANDLVARIRRKLVRQHFMHLVGADLTVITPGRVEAELMMGQQHLQQRGFAHGGLTATMADLVAGFAAVTLVPDDHGVVTADVAVLPAMERRKIASVFV